MNDRENAPVTVHDFEPETEDFLREVLEGLSKPQKTIPCKYFYDQRGSELFERICELEEYYPTRTELGIMESAAGEIADVLGPGCLLIEYGSGSSRKTRILLDHLHDCAGYVPIDISRDHLEAAAHDLRQAYPHIPILPVCADYSSEEFKLPGCPRKPNRSVVYFPGSTIGNFSREDARRFLMRMRRVAGPNGAILIGVDRKKDRETLEAAYNDAKGVTADFNLNLLARINRELEANFDLERFGHRAQYNADMGRVEMFLVSLAEQTVEVGGQSVSFGENETIHTENSHKYSLEEFDTMAAQAGLQVAHRWSDPEQLFTVHCLFAK